MDPVIGALVAAAVAWLSIWLVISVPRVGRIRPDPRVLRGAGAATIAVFGLQVLGVPAPVWLPFLTLGGGFVIAVVLAPRGYAAAA